MPLPPLRDQQRLSPSRPGIAAGVTVSYKRCSRVGSAEDMQQDLPSPLMHSIHVSEAPTHWRLAPQAPALLCDRAGLELMELAVMSADGC